MNEQEHSKPKPGLSAEQELLRDLWDEHVQYEFATRNTEDTLATMVEDACVNHIPVLVRLGLLDAGTLPVAGIETARKALNPRLPSNALIDRADQNR